MRTVWHKSLPFDVRAILWSPRINSSDFAKDVPAALFPNFTPSLYVWPPTTGDDQDHTSPLSCPRSVMDDHNHKKSCSSLGAHSALQDGSSWTSSCHTVYTRCHLDRSPTTSCTGVSVSSITLSTTFHLSQITSLSPYSRIWGQGCLRFDWKLSPDMLSVAERVNKCLRKKSKSWSPRPIDGNVLRL